MIIGILGFSQDAFAQQPVLAGYDLFETESDVELDLLGLFPDCTPTVTLIGVPTGPGSTDTIVQRLADTPILFPGEAATIPIEIIALNLQSIEPIQCATQPDVFFDVFVTIVPSAPNFGAMTIIHSHPNGGNFDSFFDVFTEITLVPVDSTEPPVQIVIPIQIQALGLWSFNPAPGNVNDETFPSGGFFAGVDPETGDKNRVSWFPRSFVSPYFLIPAMPLEPPLPVSDLGVVKFGPVEAQAGDTFRYQLRVNNFGPDTSESPVVIDTIPIEIVALSLSGTDPSLGCAYDEPNRLLQCTLPHMAPDSFFDVFFEVTVDEIFEGTISNQASVRAVNDPNDENNTSDPVITTITLPPTEEKKSCDALEKQNPAEAKGKAQGKEIAKENNNCN